MDDKSNMPGANNSVSSPAWPTTDEGVAVTHHVDFNPIRAHLTAARGLLEGKLPAKVPLASTAAGQLLLALEGLVEYLEVRAHPSMLTYVPPEPKYRSRK